MSYKKEHINFKGLENLNIENLFTTNYGNKPHTDGKLDINTLFRNNSKNSKNYSFDSQVLLDGVKKRRQKVKECYSSTYKTCCETIISANNSGLTDIIFEIPEIIPDCLDFIPYECLKYIEEKLKEQKVACLILSKIRIFITWNNIEEKINEAEANTPNTANETLSSEENIEV